MNSSFSVFQLTVNGERLDVFPSYELAMARHLQLVLDNPSHGQRAGEDHRAFVAEANGKHCATKLFAIRYVLSTVKHRRDIVEHRLSSDAGSTSVVAVIPVDTGFDPSYEIILSSYWIRTGFSSLKQEVLRVGSLGRTHARLRADHPPAETIADLIEVQKRNLGLPLLDGREKCPERSLAGLGDRMAHWLEKLAT